MSVCFSNVLRREVKLREEVLKRMEEEKQRSQGEQRKRTVPQSARLQERAMPSKESPTSRTPDGYATYRTAAVPQAMYNTEQDVTFSPGGQKSGFSDFSGMLFYLPKRHQINYA